MVEPTLCFSVRTGLRIAAIFDLLISLFMVVVSIGGIYYFERHRLSILDFFANPPQELEQFVDLKHLHQNTLRAFMGFNAIYWIQKVWLAYLLERAAAERSSSKCKVWLVYTFGLLILSIAFFLASICVQVVQPMAIPFYIVTFMVREYSIWILLRFKEKLDDGKAPLLVDKKEFTNL